MDYDAGGFQGTAYRQVVIRDTGRYSLQVDGPSRDDFAIAVGFGTISAPSPLIPALVALLGTVVGIVLIATGGRRTSEPRPRSPGTVPAYASWDGAPPVTGAPPALVRHRCHPPPTPPPPGRHRCRLRRPPHRPRASGRSARAGPTCTPGAPGAPSPSWPVVAWSHAGSASGTARPRPDPAGTRPGTDSAGTARPRRAAGHPGTARPGVPPATPAPPAGNEPPTSPGWPSPA
ncbi:MAG: hypothetical protein R2715_08005 [Ilumatobacteraceae bacterium]